MICCDVSDLVSNFARFFIHVSYDSYIPSFYPTKEPTPEADCPATPTNCFPDGCEGVCRGARGTIGDGSCFSDTADDGTCVDLNATIGEDACLGAMACFELVGEVGHNSCQFPQSCSQSHGIIMSESCRGTSSCEMNEGDVGEESCRGEEACTMNKGHIENGSCNGKYGCRNNHAAIGEGSVSFAGAEATKQFLLLHSNAHVLSICIHLWFILSSHTVSCESINLWN